LDDSDISYRVGFVVFGDVVYVYNGGSLYAHQGEILSIINNITLGEHGIGSGGDGPENQFEAMAQAASMNFRPGTQKVQILLTDAPAHEADGVTDWTRETIIDLLVAARMTVFPVFNASDALASAQYIPIAEATNPDGTHFDIYDNFDSVVDEIASMVASTYVIRYKSSRPVLDGVERHVVVTVNYSGDQATCEGTYIPGSAPSIQRTQDTLDLHGQSWAAGTQFNIRAEIRDAVAPYVQSATVYYRRTGDADYTPSPMTHSSDIWAGTIPGTAVASPGVDYYISATDGQSTVTDPSVDPRISPHQLAILPNEAPRITHTPPADVPINAPVAITAQIIDTTNALASARLHYRKTGQLIYQCNGEMTNAGGDSYRDSISSDYVTAAGVEYYIHAEDDLGVGSYHGTPDVPYVVSVSTNQPPDTKIETAETDALNGTAKFTWSGSDDSTPPAQLVYEHRLLNPDSPLYEWSEWSSSTTATYPRSPDSRLPDGTYRFQVKAKDADEAIQPSPTTWEFTIGAGAPGSIKGRVTDASIPGPSNGIVGAVLLLDPDPFTYCPVTDASGYFSFSIPAGTYNVTASAEGYVSKTAIGVVVVAGTTTVLDFALEPTSIAWVSVNRDGTSIFADNGTGSPDLARELKELPAGWVLRRMTASGKAIESSPDGGIRWFHRVEDITDGVAGWVERGDLDGGGDRSRVQLVLRGLPDAPTIPQEFVLEGFPGELSLGTRGEEVKYLQLVLKAEVGHPIYPSSVGATGYFGTITQRALMAFQKKQGLRQTGSLDESTREVVNRHLREARYELQVTRRQIVLEALSNYYNNTETSASLYHSNDRGNHLGRFLENGFPVELILAMVAQETHSTFDNQFVSFDCGRGIVQVTTDSLVGQGSGISCGCWRHRRQGSACQFDDSCACYQYTNSHQGIFANIKDGLRKLSTSYATSLKRNGQDASLGDQFPMLVNWKEWAGALWRYNGLVDNSNYLVNIGKRLETDDTKFVSRFPAYKSAFPSNDLLATSAREKLAELLQDYTSAGIRSPGELRIIDSQGRATGVVDGEGLNDIPNSDWENGNSIVYGPGGSYQYVVAGIEDGEYELVLTYALDDAVTLFTALSIPITQGALHEYTVDWDALARGEEGVTLQIDNDGDGTFERTIHAGSTLDGTTTPVGNQPPQVNILAPVVGEVVSGANYQIKWKATDQDDPSDSLLIDLSYSIDGGATWTSIATGEENDGAYSWDISSLHGGEYWLKIVATDPEGGTAEATTGPFIISTFDGTIIIGPNPVTGAGTAFFYSLPDGTSTAQVMVFNAAGRAVFNVLLDVDSSRFPNAGTWDPVDQDGVPLANGPYIHVLIADGKVIGQGKMVIQR